MNDKCHQSIWMFIVNPTATKITYVRSKLLILQNLVKLLKYELSVENCFGCVSDYFRAWKEVNNKIWRGDKNQTCDWSLKEPNLTNTGELTENTFFVLLHIRGFIWNRGQTILLYAIECDTLSFSLAVKIPDFGHWMRRAAAKPSTKWVEIISELVFLLHN